MMTRPSSSLRRRLFGRAFRLRARRRADALAEFRERRDRDHRDRDGADQCRRERPVDEPAGKRRADHHEAEFPAGPEQHRHFGADARRQPERPREPDQDEALDGDQRGGEAEDEAGPGKNERRIDLGPDGDEVEPEQQALERLDRHFDFAAVLSLRQQEPGDEGAERHREAARRGGQTVAQHHQEAGGHEEFGALRLGHETKERPERNAPEDDQRRERQCGWDERAEKRPAEPPLVSAREGARHHEKGRDREILKEQHGEARAADRSAEPLALDEDRDHDRRRGHGERRADRRRGSRGQAEHPGDRAERQRRNDDLPKPEPEHQPAHPPQPLERQFEPHGEQKRDDPERGELVDRLDIDREGAEPRRLLAQRAKAVGAERDAREQKSEHRTDAQAEEQGRDDARRRQEEQRLLVNRKVGRLVHFEVSGAGAEPSLVDSNGGGPMC